MFGFEPSVVNAIQTRRGFIDEINYRFICLGTIEQAYKRLMSCDCDAVIGNVTPTAERVRGMNITFSSPIMSSSLAVLTRTTTDKHFFSFLEPFETPVWIVIAVIPIFFSLLVFLFFIFHSKRIAQRKKLDDPASERVPKMTKFNLEFVYSIFGVGELRQFIREDFGLGYSSILNLTFVSFLFFFLFIISVYTANLASIIIANNYNYQIDDISFLSSNPKARVLSNNIYVDLLLDQYNIKADGWKWFQNTESVIEASRMVLNNSIDALISDRGLLLHGIRELDSCGVNLLPGSDVSYFGSAVAFSSCVPREDVDAFNFALLQIQGSGELDRIGRTSLSMLYYRTTGIASYETFVNPSCRPNSKIGLDDVYGLLVIVISPPILLLLTITVQTLFGPIAKFIGDFAPISSIF